MICSMCGVNTKLPGLYGCNCPQYYGQLGHQDIVPTNGDLKTRLASYNAILATFNEELARTMKIVENATEELQRLKEGK